MSTVRGISLACVLVAFHLGHALTFLTQPQDGTVTIGYTAGFHVYVAGDPPITYQWLHNGTNMPGANDYGVRIGSTHLSDAGEYWVIVTNPSGSITSQVATLTIITQPQILQEPDSVAASAGDTISFSAITVSPYAMVYQWQKNGSPLMDATNTTLTLSNVSSLDVASYRLIVSNAVGGLSATSAVATLALHTIPILLTQPRNATTRIYGDAFFSITATSATSISFSWRKNSMPVPGSDGATLVFKNARFSDAGMYDVVVATPAGSVTSAPVTLTVSSNRLVGTVVGLNAPFVPSGLTNALAISAGPHLNTAMLADGSVRMWTDSLGHYLFGSTVAPAMTNIVAVVSGELSAAYALNEKGEVLNWGNATPTGISNAVSIAMWGGPPLYVVFSDGTVQGSLLPGGLSNVVSFAMPRFVLRRNSTVISISGHTITVIDSNVVSIAGRSSYMSLHADGTVTGPLAGLSNVVAIAEQCCSALLADGTVVMANNSSPVNGAFAISTTSKHSLVLTTNPPAPLVEAYVANNGIGVSAAISVSGYLLESGSTVTGPFTPVVLAATNDLIFLPAPGEQKRFFRLRKE